MASKGDIDKNKIQPSLYNKWLLLPFEISLNNIGSFVKLKTSEYFDSGIYPVIDQGDKMISGYVDDVELLYQGELPIIIFGDHSRNIKYVDFDFAVGADGTKILNPVKQINKKFFFYYLKSLIIPDFGYSRHYSILKKIDIPLPLLAEQERIVKKLDALFTQLDRIRAAMDRIPQLLKNFRQQVLTQAVTGKLTEKWLEFNLNDLGKWVGGGTPSKNNSAYWLNGNIPWITPKDMKESFLGDSIDKITPIAVDNSSAILIPKNSVLVVMRSGILRRTLPVAMNIVETTVNQDLKAVILKDFINPVFFLYSLIAREADIRNQCMKSGTTVESIEFSLLKEYTIGVPPLQEQEEIVRRIDSLFRQADAIEEQYKSLKNKIDTLPQAILHKAFKGELVEQHSSDGDARDLLRQIEELKKQNKKK